LNNYVASAQSSIRRRNELAEIIAKDEAQLKQMNYGNVMITYSSSKSNLPISQNAKHAELIEKNSNNIAHLQEIDSILLDELRKFESDIIAEIDKVAREFMSHQTQYAKKVTFPL